MSDTILVNDFPKDVALWFTSTILYLVSGVIAVIIFIISWCVYRPKLRAYHAADDDIQEFEEEDEETFVSCSERLLSPLYLHPFYSFTASLICSFLVTLCWCIGSGALYTMSKLDEGAPKQWKNVYTYAAAIGYVFQSCYFVAIGCFVANKLIHTFNPRRVDFLAVRQHAVLLMWLLYSVAAIAFNILYLVADAHPDTDSYGRRENHAISWVWGVVCLLYNVFISSVFVITLRRYMNLDSEASPQRENQQIFKKIMKETVFIFFIAVFMILYAIGTAICFYHRGGHSKKDLVGWHWLYFVLQGVIIPILTSLSFASWQRYDTCCRYLAVLFSCNRSIFEQHSSQPILAIN